ncbi:glycosyl transferase family 1 [Bacillus cereus]|uniref:Glycosyl transferase family 1 n=1 Tax=Bacillus cereus TaxID=1396 RepID=A0A2B9QEJ4_BACCE|nr:glycosyltransferase family 1 protein [Bacillus cereus]PGO33396.1 glycosyl transferase family 1 [Bacillus cereus]
MANAHGIKRVLHIVSAMNRGGTETLLMNIYRKLDRNKVQFDFISHRNEQDDYDEEIIGLGGKIYKIPSLGKVGPYVYIKKLVGIMSDNCYVAVHVHTDYQGGFAAVAAQMSGVKKRICHSHSNNWPKGSGMTARITLRILQSIIKYAGTNFCACSVEAARFLFGEKMIKKNKIQVIKNAIDINQFVNENIRDTISLRKELDIPEEAKVIGHIGRFSTSKNHSFLLQVLKEILNKDANFIAILVGDGPLKDSIELEAKKLEIYNNIRFLGIREDVPRLMKVFDVFIFPSIFEGFGMVALEAQCAGVPCIVSDTIPKNIDMNLGIVSFVALDEKIEVWSVEIYKALLKERPERKMIINNISQLGFDVNSNIFNWLSLYGIEYEEYLG